MQSEMGNFTSIWCVVFAVELRPGELLYPIAASAMELSAVGSAVQVGLPELRVLRQPPYATGQRALIVTVDAQLLVGCHIALGWRLPERIIDLMLEFRNCTNGRRMTVGGLAGALLWYGQPTRPAFVSGTLPQNMLQRLQAVASLFAAMPLPDLGLALLRGRYMRAVATIEATGVPVDLVIVKRLASNWPAIRAGVVATVDRAFGVYSGTQLNPDAFGDWLKRRGLEWPTNASGQLDLTADVFREMVRAYPDLRPLKELQTTLAGPKFVDDRP